MLRSIWVALVAYATWGPAPLVAQAVAGGSLELVASAGTSRTLTPDDPAALPQDEVLVPGGRFSRTVAGTPLRDLLEAGAPAGAVPSRPATSLGSRGSG